MKYNEELYNISKRVYNATEQNTSLEEAEWKEKQEKVLKILLNNFQEQIECSGKENKHFLSVKIQRPSPVYKELDELIKNHQFDVFAREYCMYLTEKKDSCDENQFAYYEIIWDYRTYYEHCKRNPKMLPYPVGTTVYTKEFDKIHVDKVNSYYVVLWFDGERLSNPIELSKFEEHWTATPPTTSPQRSRNK